VPHWGHGGSSWGMIAGTMVAKRGHGASLGRGGSSGIYSASLGTWWLIVRHDGSLGTWLHIRDVLAHRGT
jgi:hypothetical protein